jgi:hypothetical protein
MKYRKAVKCILHVSSLFIFFVLTTWLTGGTLGVTTLALANESKTATQEKEAKKKRTTGPMRLGKFFGQVVYNHEKDLYFLELRGVRFPFKSSPIEAQDVLLEASGKTDLEKNTSLLYGVLGKKVVHATLLIDPNEEDEVMPAVADLARYIQIANRSKFAGIAYTKSGGKLKRSIAKGPQIQALEDATAKTPIVLIKGPKSGAKKTRVVATEGGKVIVEGKTFEDLYKAADRICITLIKMLCGSSDCPDAGACATGGSCGCG